MLLSYFSVTTEKHRHFNFLYQNLVLILQGAKCNFLIYL